MITPLSAPVQTSPEGTGHGTPASSQAVDKNMFMQLMIAQMRNQDPLSPRDGTEFVAQLAQFQHLEQAVNAGQELEAIRQDLDQLVAAFTVTITP
jgi:flagellar basal-body rod modification protein FlgD